MPSVLGAVVGAAAGVAVTSMVDGKGTMAHAIGAAIGAFAGYYLLGMLGLP